MYIEPSFTPRNRKHPVLVQNRKALTGLQFYWEYEFLGLEIRANLETVDPVVFEGIIDYDRL